MPTIDPLSRAATRLSALVLMLAAPAVLASPPEVPGMEAARSVWMGTCGLCHAEPMTGAPQLADKAAWAPRIAKGVPALYANAINGFFGPMGDEMPPRGANPDLSDDEVKAAVDYMIAVSGAQ